MLSCLLMESLTGFQLHAVALVVPSKHLYIDFPIRKYQVIILLYCVRMSSPGVSGYSLFIMICINCGVLLSVWLSGAILNLHSSLFIPKNKNHHVHIKCCLTDSFIKSTYNCICSVGGNVSSLKRLSCRRDQAVLALKSKLQDFFSQLLSR